MEQESIHREVEKTKELLKNPLLKYNERHALETYFASLKKENAE